MLSDDGTGWSTMPVRSLEKVDEVDPQRLLGLAHLPILASAVAFQVLTEPTDLVREGLVRGRPREKSAHPAHAVWRRSLSHQPRLQQELAELLERGLDLAHGPPRSSSAQPACHLYAGTGSAAAAAGCGVRHHSDPLHRRPTLGPVATAVDINPVDWRLLPSDGIPVLSRRPQSMAGEHKESSKPLRGTHLTGQHNADRMAPTRQFRARRVDGSASGDADWRCPPIQR